MPVVLRHNETLELNVSDYAGAITTDQLKGVADYCAAHPHFLKADVLNIVREDADFTGIDFPALDILFARYRKLFAPLSFQIYRRSAWLCLSKTAAPHINYWVGERDQREALSSTVRKFETFGEAADWLLLSAAEIGAVEHGEGFVDLAVFDQARAPVQALAR